MAKEAATAKAAMGAGEGSVVDFAAAGWEAAGWVAGWAVAAALKGVGAVGSAAVKEV